MNQTADRFADYKAQAEILKALAHPTRLLIIHELSEGERCVWELTRLVGHEMPTISRHLSLLKFAGVVEDHKRGYDVFYRLKRRCVMQFFRCVAALRRQQGPTHPRYPKPLRAILMRTHRRNKRGERK